MTELKNKRYFQYWTGVFVTFMILSFFGFKINRGSPRFLTRSLTCISNIKIIENALELYDMEKKTKNGPSLIKGVGESCNEYPASEVDYIKKYPVCLARKTGDSYDVYFEKVKNSRVICVKCKLHGSVADAEKGIVEYKKNRITYDKIYWFIAITLFIFWNFVGAYFKQTLLETSVLLISAMIAAILISHIMLPVNMT